jgi:hypothetical protein
VLVEGVKGSLRKLPVNIQKTLPVIASIGIILLVAVLRDRSRTLAAILATMPINIPLGIWVISSGSDVDSKALAEFVKSMTITLIPAWVWLVVVFFAVRAEWNLWAAIGTGYAVWAVLIAIMFWLGILNAPK